MIKDCLRHCGSRENEATNSVLRTEEGFAEEVISESNFKDKQDFGKLNGGQAFQVEGRTGTQVSLA